VDPWLLALLGALLVAFVLAFFASIRLQLNGQARGDPSGAWAVAGGGQLGPVIASGLAGRGLPGRIEVRIFGKLFWKKALDQPDEPSEPDPERLERTRKRVTGGYALLERWFDPLDLLIFLVGEKRRIRFEHLEIELAYSFEDPLVTGKLMGAVHMLNGVLPSQIVVRQDVSWEFVDRARIALDGRIRLWPGLLLVDTAAFVVRRVKLRKRPPAKREAPEST
jgi:hypothetical protein